MVRGDTVSLAIIAHPVRGGLLRRVHARLRGPRPPDARHGDDGRGRLHHHPHRRVHLGHLEPRPRRLRLHPRRPRHRRRRDLNTIEEAVREQLRPEATKRANAELVIDAFAKLENIEVSEEEIDKEIDEFGKNMKVKDFEEFKKELKSGEGLEGITASLIRRKAVDHLVSLVKFQEPKKETVEE